MKNYTQLLSHLFILLLFLFTATITDLRAQHAYITNSLSGTVTVINVNTGAFVATIPVGALPSGVAVSSNGQRIYIANSGAASVSVIDGNTNTVIATIGVGVAPIGLALTPDDGTLYVANYLSNSVSPINTATLTAGLPIALAPNPASEQIDLNWGISYPYAILSVYDATGRLHIRKEASQQAYARMDIGHLAPGLYTVALNVGQESASKRLLIQR